MAKVYYRLDEIDSDSKAVYSYYLGGQRAPARLSWNTQSGNSNDLKWFEMDTSFDVRGDGIANGQFKFVSTWFLANVVGTIDYANTVLTPRALESVIRIADYPYANAANKLVLYLGVAHGESSFSASGSKISTGQALQQVYVQLAGDCKVVVDRNAKDGDSRSVSISAWSSNDAEVKDIFHNSEYRVHLQSKFNANWDVSRITVTFPANASNIVYDPTLAAGASTSANPPSSDASAFAPSYLFALLLATLLGLYLF